jgi:predicted Zn-dependent peptidase
MDTVPPALAEPRTLRVPPISEHTLPNGLRLLVVEHHELPVADVLLLVRTGGEADPPGRAGLATLTASLLDEGTHSRDALAIADQAAYLGVSLSTSSGWDASSIALHAPTARLDSALALLADVALQPSFPGSELERLRQERLTELMQLRDRGPAIADRAFASAVFGDGHPYGQPLSGTTASTKAITRADVRRFYDTYYRPNNVTLIVIGDVRPDDVVARVARLFGDWAPADVPAVRFTEPPKPAATTVYVVDRPGAPQSSVRIGTVGVPRATDDFFPLLVMNTILGGSFTSRLNMNLRETRGYTYGAGSSFAMRQVAGPFTARAEVVAAKTDSSLLEFMKELRGIRDTVPAGELEKARRYLVLQLPGEFETTGDIARQLVPVALYGLPLSYYDAYAQHLLAVTQEDVQRVAQRYVDPATMAVVVVGDRKSIEPAIEAARIGRTEVRELPPM